MEEELTGQQCPICRENKCTLREEEMDVAYFGKTFIFSMTCEGCGYRKADVESAEQKEPCKYTLEISEDADLNARIVKSSEGTVKIPHIITIESGPESEGYVTNVEGLLTRVKKILESSYEAEEEDNNKNKLKNMIKKLNKVLAGHEKLTITISDPSGNSAIISDKAIKSGLK
ncbi:MAG TPA: ZPR1-type zinc finger protein [Candidatus Nanoarchaeia archaeon]|nr:ZPR1-type zinc finger protein [Candidatus Nanoarchaeia archaeon]